MSDIESLSVQLQKLLVENAHRVGGVVESLLDLVKQSQVATADQQTAINELLARVELLESEVHNPGTAPSFNGTAAGGMANPVLLPPLGSTDEI